MLNNLYLTNGIVKQFKIQKLHRSLDGCFHRAHLCGHCLATMKDKRHCQVCCPIPAGVAVVCSHQGQRIRFQCQPPFPSILLVSFKQQLTTTSSICTQLNKQSVGTK